jgi:hypothetical protein
VKDVKDLNCSGLGLGSIPVDACRDSISELLAVKRNGKKTREETATKATKKLNEMSKMNETRHREAAESCKVKPTYHKDPQEIKDVAQESQLLVSAMLPNRCYETGDTSRFG